MVRWFDTVTGNSTGPHLRFEGRGGSRYVAGINPHDVAEGQAVRVFGPDPKLLMTSGVFKFIHKNSFTVNTPSGLDARLPLSALEDGTYRLEVKMPVEETPEKPVEWVTTGVDESNDVNHPLHYNQDPSGVECIQIVRHRNYNIGNAFKYLWRAGLKDADAHVQDLEKAAWHIRDEIDRLEGQV